MTKDQQKRIAYDLAIEYVKENRKLIDVESNIPQLTEKFSIIYEKFYNALDSSNLQNLL